MVTLLFSHRGLKGMVQRELFMPEKLKVYLHCKNIHEKYLPTKEVVW